MQSLASLQNSNFQKSVILSVGYVSQYPPAYNDTYVKASSAVNDHLYAYFTFNPALSLTGAWDYQQWMANGGTNQRLHVDLGSAKIIKRIYYENSHYAPDMNTYEGTGAKNFTFWGSNDANAFINLVYADNTNWTQLTTDVSVMDKHAMVDAPDPKYIMVTNTTAYRYYAFKFADSWDNASYIGVRRIELQTLG